MHTFRTPFALLCALAAPLLGAACTLPVDTRDDVTPRPLTPVPGEGPIDILFVVDNSGSMADEHARLAAALWDDACPIDDLTAVPQALMHPDAETRDALLADCGLAQMLAAYDRDFRVGVITTDVNACDNVYPEAMGGTEWGHRPQRGCLQPVPATGQKVLTRTDDNLARDFLSTLTAIGTWGSPWERGLDAADIFLTHSSWVSEGCEGDREAFLRADAELLVVFVTDEDDCSHLGAPDFPDIATTTCGADPEFFARGDARTCMSTADLLNPVSTYGEQLRALKGDWPVRVAVIGGVDDDADGGGELSASGCVYTGAEPALTCFESGGLSHFTQPGAVCSPEEEAARGTPCCTADGAHRYVALGHALDSAPDSALDSAPGADASALSGGSICRDDYRVPLLEAAIAAQLDAGGQAGDSGSDS